MELQEALKVLIEEEHTGDFVYTIRDRAGEMADGFKGSSWDHPRVTRWSEAVERLTQEMKR